MPGQDRKVGLPGNPNNDIVLRRGGQFHCWPGKTRHYCVSANDKHGNGNGFGPLKFLNDLRPDLLCYKDIPPLTIGSKGMAA